MMPKTVRLKNFTNFLDAMLNLARAMGDGDLPFPTNYIFHDVEFTLGFCRGEDGVVRPAIVLMEEPHLFTGLDNQHIGTFKNDLGTRSVYARISDINYETVILTYLDIVSKDNVQMNSFLVDTDGDMKVAGNVSYTENFIEMAQMFAVLAHESIYANSIVFLPGDKLKKETTV